MQGRQVWQAFWSGTKSREVEAAKGSSFSEAREKPAASSKVDRVAKTGRVAFFMVIQKILSFLKLGSFPFTGMRGNNYLDMGKIPCCQAGLSQILCTAVLIGMALAPVWGGSFSAPLPLTRNYS